MRKIINLILIFLPWSLRRRILNIFYKYEIDKTAKIGFSYIYPDKLKMGPNARIGHLNVAVNLHYVEIGENSIISRKNWITGFPINTKSQHFSHQKNRVSELIIGKESAITSNHHIDCTNSIKIGDFVTIAGYQSQFLTHSIDIYNSRQDSYPIEIGNYCFVSTNVIVLGGSILPNNSVLAAGAILNKQFTEEWIVYGGVPAKPIKNITKKAKYFYREEGYIN